METVGFWERPGKSPVVAAFVTTILVVALYSLIGNVTLLAFLLGDLGGLVEAGLQDAKLDVLSRYRAPILAVTAAGQFLVFGLGTALLFRLWHGVPLKPRFGIVAPRPAAVPLALLGAAGMVPLAIWTGEFFPKLFPGLREAMDMGDALYRATTPGQVALLFLAVCVAPATCEEFLFRGYFQSTLSRGMRAPWSWLLAGTFFALVHQNYFGLVPLVLVGVYLAWVYERTGSIWPGVAVHAFYNGALLLAGNVPSLFGWAFRPDGFLNGWVAAAGTLTLALAVAGLARGRSRPSRLRETAPAGTAV